MTSEPAGVTTPAEPITAAVPGPGREVPRRDGTHPGDVIAPPPGLPASVESAARWVIGHPGVVLPLLAAAAVFYFSPARSWVISLILAGLAALFTWSAVMRFRYREKFRSRRARAGRPGLHVMPEESPAADAVTGWASVQASPALAGHGWAAEAPPPPAAAFFRAAQQEEPPSRPALPDTAAVLRAANKLIAGLQPGPERITAGIPGDVRVQWDDDVHLVDPARVDKMKIIVRMFRSAADGAGLLHRFPQLLLIADNGAVAEVYGDWNCGRTGTVITAPAPA